MKSLTHHLRLRSRGGILPIRSLRTLAEFSMVNSTEPMRIHTRQDVLVGPIDPTALKHFPGLRNLIEIESIDQVPTRYSITTTRPARHLSKRIAWLDDSAFQEVLDHFTVAPMIRVALSDPTQHIVPIFSGDVIFLATEVRGYWQIVLQNNHEPLYFSQDAVPSERIPDIVHFLELCMGTAPDTRLAEIYESLQYQFNDEMISVDAALAPIPEAQLDFLGFQPSMESGKYTLGIHCPHGEYPPAFVQEICVLARKQQIKQLALSPTGALIIPSISPTDTAPWRRLFGRYGVPLHPEGYAPYTLCADDSSSRNLATKLHAALKQRKFSASGLSLSIDGEVNDGEASIHIAHSPESNRFFRRFRKRYTLRYFEHFDPQHGECITVSSELSFEALMDSLCSLIDTYHLHETINIPQLDTQETGAQHSGNTHTCSDCLSQYNPQWGDPRSGIDPGIPFELLPSDWSCPVCEGSKTLFTVC